MNKHSSKRPTDLNTKSQVISEDGSVELEANDDLYFSSEDERISKKMAARRKIDIYMEKKRLKEELELNDFLYDEFDL